MTGIRRTPRALLIGSGILGAISMFGIFVALLKIYGCVGNTTGACSVAGLRKIEVSVRLLVALAVVGVISAVLAIYLDYAAKKK